MNNLTITRAIVIPSYSEDLALLPLLTTLAGSLSNDNVVIVAHDLKPAIRARIASSCENAMINSLGTLDFSFTKSKSGRGAAVRGGMKLAKEEYPNLVSIMKCHAVRSHQPQDISRLRDSSISCDLLVDSRYLKKSQIVRWLTTRRIFSRIQNILISFLLHLYIKNITNSLRKYSSRVVDLNLSNKANSTDFIHLSEQPLLISRSGFEIQEIPIVFTDRELGSSTVTWREIINSIIGINKLVSLEFGSRFMSK